VILAKIGRATFHTLVRPGDTLTFSAKIDQFSQQGASASGTVTTDGRLVAEIELMFSHIDQNMAGMEFPNIICIHRAVYGVAQDVPGTRKKFTL